MSPAFIPSDRPEPEFMARIRRMFVEGLPDRVERMRRGLAGVAADVEAGRPPGAHYVEDLFLASHSLKGTAPSVGADDVGWEAGELSEVAREWSPDHPPTADELDRARSHLERVEKACESYRAEWLASGALDDD